MKFLTTIFTLSAALSFAGQANADGEGRPDIQIIASDSSTPAGAPNCFKKIGHWDVDDGGAFGSTNGSNGDYMTGMYILDKESTNPFCDFSKATDIEDIKLVASNQSSPDFNWQSQHNLFGYQLIGYWDVDKGGAKGDLNSSGSYMMFMYAKPYTSGISVTRIRDLQIRASNESYPPNAPGNGYERLGYWDVDKGGAVGTDGSSGEYMTALFAEYDYNP